MGSRQDNRFAWQCAVTILLGAFLLFQVQPVISKTILPWFGGSPAVWTTCMLFFQVVLLAGYAYADVLARIRRPFRHAIVHVPLLFIALVTLLLTRAELFKPTDSSQPTWRILILLLACVGLPYFLLSTTGPLVQSWFARVYPQRSPYRLYALSNIGSLVALLSYPVIVERAFTIHAQGLIWKCAFAVYAILAAWLVVTLSRQGDLTGASPTEPNDKPSATKKRKDQLADSNARALLLSRHALWILLPALGSIMLLAVTNHLCQNVAVVPFLWIAPLSLYLVSFIICFDKDQWYARRWFSLGVIVAILMVCNVVFTKYVNRPLPGEETSASAHQATDNVFVQIVLYLLALFLVCMVCHGEVVRTKPAVGKLTAFYLSVSAGGAIGGLFVTLVCPWLFDSYMEMSIGLVISFAVAVAVVLLDGWNTWLTAKFADNDSIKNLVRASCCVGAIVGLLVVVWAQMLSLDTESVVAIDRNFYGVLSVKLRYSEGHPSYGRALYNGDTIHGYQFYGDERRHKATLYFADDSGVGVTLRRFPRKKPMRVGVIGLGAGTVAAFGRKGDYYRFYEINPNVIEYANKYFTFLEDCRATPETVLGDGRLELEQKLKNGSQQYDVLVLDAFSGDSIPAHLLTKEAFAVYQSHLRDKNRGVLAFHVSNRYLNLVPVVGRLAEHYEMSAVLLNQQHDGEYALAPSEWVLVTNNREFIEDKVVREMGKELPSGGWSVPLWTDQYNNLIQILGRR